MTTMQFLNDNRFLSGIHSYERLLAKLLAVLLAVVVGVGTLELFIETITKTISLQTNWFDGSLIKLLDRLLLTALTAVARKVIVLQPATVDKPALMAGFGLIVVVIATAYWLVQHSRRVAQATG